MFVPVTPPAEAVHTNKQIAQEVHVLGREVGTHLIELMEAAKPGKPFVVFSKDKKGGTIATLSGEVNTPHTKQPGTNTGKVAVEMVTGVSHGQPQLNDIKSLQVSASSNTQPGGQDSFFVKYQMGHDKRYKIYLDNEHVGPTPPTTTEGAVQIGLSGAAWAELIKVNGEHGVEATPKLAHDIYAVTGQVLRAAAADVNLGDLPRRPIPLK